MTFSYIFYSYLIVVFSLFFFRNINKKFKKKNKKNISRFCLKPVDQILA